MADSTLDDFFAKKDKSKKGKKTSKFTTSDTITKKLEGGKKIELIPKKDNKEKVPLSSNIQSIMIPTASTEQEDDEWTNIEEKETDYSGLRIQALSISEKEKEEEQQREQMLSEQNGDSNRMNDGQSGPWKVMHNPSAELEEEKSSPSESAPSEAAKEEPAAPKPTGAYKPPALRNITSSSSPSVRRHPKHAPQISSEVHFPSLSSAVDSKFRLSESDRSFQSVKHGVRSKGDSQKELHLDLENKFSALND